MQVSHVATLWAAAAFILLATTAFAQPAEPEACDMAFAEGQQLRKTGRLATALEALAGCRDVHCDDVVRRLCRSAESDIAAAMPTVILVVKDASSRETLSFALHVDGERYSGRLDRPIEVDPGERELAVELDGNARKQRVVLREGEKGRRLEIDFTATLPPVVPQPEPSMTPRPQPSSQRPAALTGIQVAGIIVGVAGLGGIGTAAGLGAWAVSTHNEAKKDRTDIGRVNELNRNADDRRSGAIASGVIGTTALLGGITMLVFGAGDDEVLGKIRVELRGAEAASIGFHHRF